MKILTFWLDRTVNTARICLVKLDVANETLCSRDYEGTEYNNQDGRPEQNIKDAGALFIYLYYLKGRVHYRGDEVHV